MDSESDIYWERLGDAVQAVRRLHFRTPLGGWPGCAYQCSACHRPWPCPTEQAIAKALGEA